MVQWEPEFLAREFRHPELINPDAYKGLVEIRRQFGKVLIITDDARLPGEMPPGASVTSLHFKGQAFDIRIRDFTAEDLWRFVRACMNVGEWVVKGAKQGMELELVWSKTDKHAHIGFYLDGRANRFELNLE